jgi:hypothetical protein
VPPLCSSHHHINHAVSAARTHETISPVENRGIRAISSSHLSGAKLDLVAARLHHTISRMRAAAVLPSVIGRPDGDFMSLALDT